MTTPLKNVPLNTQRLYIRGTTKDGCEVYVPVDTRDSVEADKKQADLQTFLDNQNLGAIPPCPPTVA